MRSACAQRTVALRLPKLAAITLVFLGLSTNAHLDAAPVSAAAIILPQPRTAPEIKYPPVPDAQDSNPIHILSPKDAALYSAAFAAQEQADWKKADEILNQIRDKKLIGHVLADRYLRRPADLSDIRQWLASYPDLPEAQPLYDRAKSLKGFAGEHIARPAAAASWTGNNDTLDAASGFRSQPVNDNADDNRVGDKINAALRRGDPIRAREILATEVQRGSVPIEDTDDFVAPIAAAFYYQGEIERARPMAHSAAEAGIPLGLWIDGLSAWKQQDFLSSSRSFANLAQAPGLSAWDRAAAAFWAYRAARRSGDETQARRWLAEAAKYPRSFYGALAASLTGKSPDHSWKMPELNAKNIDILARRPAGWRALALVQIGRNDLAESDLRRLNPAGRRDLQKAALALAEKAHMPSLILQLASLAKNDNGQPYEAALYPVPPWQPANGFKVDRALIYALIRRESQFHPEAVSDRGACGLMQIMPSTARAIAGGKNTGADCPDRLFDPATNMEMGQRYVRVLAGQPMIGNNLLLLLAAYNGGPGNLARWLDGDNRADPLLFVESLPVRETRDYVQQVLTQYWMYRARMAQPDTAAIQLARGEWPRYALRDEPARRAEAQGLEEVASAGR